MTRYVELRIPTLCCSIFYRRAMQPRQRLPAGTVQHLNAPLGFPARYASFSALFRGSCSSWIIRHQSKLQGDLAAAVMLPSITSSTSVSHTAALTTSVFRFKGLGNAYTCLSYLAFLFSVSIRSLAAGPDEAGFWPVISWPSTTV